MNLRNAVIALTIVATPAVLVAAPVVTVGASSPSAVAEARPGPEKDVYCGPGYYPPSQYHGRCVRIKHLKLGKPSILKPWLWF